jgi:hypothetical protein
MTVQWRKDIEVALSKAKQSGRPLLLDFSATPG